MHAPRKRPCPSQCSGKQMQFSGRKSMSTSQTCEGRHRTPSSVVPVGTHDQTGYPWRRSARSITEAPSLRSRTAPDRIKRARDWVRGKPVPSHRFGEVSLETPPRVRTRKLRGAVDHHLHIVLGGLPEHIQRSHRGQRTVFGAPRRARTPQRARAESPSTSSPLYANGGRDQLCRAATSPLCYQVFRLFEKWSAQAAARPDHVVRPMRGPVDLAVAPRRRRWSDLV